MRPRTICVSSVTPSEVTILSKYTLGSWLRKRNYIVLKSIIVQLYSKANICCLLEFPYSSTVLHGSYLNLITDRIMLLTLLIVQHTKFFSFSFDDDFLIFKYYLEEMTDLCHVCGRYAGGVMDSTSE